MLKGIPPLIGPELLRELAQMGHTAELTIGDGNFPGHTYGKKVIRMDGLGIPEILEAILKLFPLDEDVQHPVALMNVREGANVKTPIWEEYKRIVAKYDRRGAGCFETLDKPDFYRRTREHSEVVIMTSEPALYANLILKKGVVLPE